MAAVAAQGKRKVTLAVSERFRGGAGDTLEIQTEFGTEACGYPFEVGHDYLVFANRRDGIVTVTTCSATQPAKKAMAKILLLRARRDGATLPDLFGSVVTHPTKWDFEGWEQIQPVPHLAVTARSNKAEYRTQTDSNGLYSFHDLPRDQYRLTVAAPAGRRALWGGSAQEVAASQGAGCPTDFEIF